MSWVVFFMLKAYGRGTWVWSFFTSDLASFYAGAFFQLTTDLMGGLLCGFLYPFEKTRKPAPAHFTPTAI